jgi:hypothetical protein
VLVNEEEMVARSEKALMVNEAILRRRYFTINDLLLVQLEILSLLSHKN